MFLYSFVTLAKNCCQVSTPDIPVINAPTMKNNFKIFLRLDFLFHLSSMFGEENMENSFEFKKKESFKFFYEVVFLYFLNPADNKKENLSWTKSVDLWFMTEHSRQKCAKHSNWFFSALFARENWINSHSILQNTARKKFC